MVVVAVIFCPVAFFNHSFMVFSGFSEPMVVCTGYGVKSCCVEFASCGLSVLGFASAASVCLTFSYEVSPSSAMT